MAGQTAARQSRQTADRQSPFQKINYQPSELSNANFLTTIYMHYRVHMNTKPYLVNNFLKFDETLE
jgi:hypothetical protein